MRFFLSALCALLIGCTPTQRQGADRAAWSEPYVATTTYLVAVDWAPTLPIGGMLAWGVQTSTLFGVPRSITLSGQMIGDDNLCRNVAAHEIGHALGLPHMSHGGYIWMRPSHDLGLPLIPEPSMDELSRARGRMTGKRLMLDLAPDLPPRLHAAILWACHAWNRAFQREVLVLR